MTPHPFSRFSAPFILTLLALGPVLGARPAAGATVHLNNNQQVTGIIDEAASDETQLVIKTKDAVLKIPRAKIARIDRQDAAPAAEAASQGEQTALNQAESALAGDPTNAALRKKVDELRKRIQSQALLNYGVFFEKLDVLMKAQKFDEAVSEAEAIVGRISDPGARSQFKRLKAQAHIGLAHRFHEFVNYRQEEENYNKAMEDDPENPVAPLELADLLQVSPSRRAEAVRLYEKGIALSETHPGTIDPNLLLDYEYKLADLYLNERQYVAAGDRFLKVMLADKQFRHAQADDSALGAYSRLPVTEMDDSTRTHVIANTRKILAAKPGKQAGYLLLGRIFFDRRQWAEARDNLTAAIKNAGPRPEEESLQSALFDLVIALRRLRQDKDAALVLQRLLAMRPRHYDALCELAEICMANDAFTEAQNLYEQALAGDAEKHRAHLGKGLAQQNQGKYEEARLTFKGVLDRVEKDAPAQLAIARSYFAEKKYDEAITESEKALQFIRDHYKKEEDTGGKAGDNTTNTAPVPGAAGSAEDPLAATTQTAAAAPATTQTAAAAPATTHTAVAAPATTATLAANAATTPPAAAMAGTTQTAVAAAPTTPTLASEPAAPTLASELATPKVGSVGVNVEDLAMLDVITPEDRQVWAEANTLIGKAHTMSKRTNQARDYFNAALKFEPMFAEAFEGLGLSYAEDQLDAQAVENFQKAIELDPENPQYNLSLATYYHKTRKPADPAKALPFYIKYQALGGRDPGVSERIKECGGK